LKNVNVMKRKALVKLRVVIVLGLCHAVMLSSVKKLKLFLKNVVHHG